MSTTRSVRGLVLLVLCGLLALIQPAAARADIAVPLVDSGTTGSVTIHRLQGPDLDPAVFPADGSLFDPPPGSVPVPGAEYTVTRIDGVDLTTPAGWQLAQSYMSDLALAKQHLGAAVTSPRTSADGSTCVDGLSVGLYLVHEKGVYAKGALDPSSLPAGDFLVTVPIRDAQTGGWRFEVNAYPKAGHITLKKSVADGNVGVPGQDAPAAWRTLTYTVDSSLPQDGLRGFGGRCLRNGTVDLAVHHDANGFLVSGLCAPGATYQGAAAGGAFQLVDDLATQTVPGTTTHTSDYLELIGTSPAFTSPVSVSVGGTVLRVCGATPQTCDYTLQRTTSKVLVSMTDRGIQALADARAADATATVRLQFQARVRPSVQNATRQSAGALDSATAARALTLPNTAAVLPNGAAVSTGTAIPSNTVRTIYANLKLHKVDAATAAPLAGAAFTLYRTQRDAQRRADPVAVSTPTDSRGMAQIPGLHVNDIQNDGPADDSYWLVETVAPRGYVADAAPVRVRVLSDGTTQGADTSAGLRITNDRRRSGNPTSTPVLRESTPRGTTQVVPGTIRPAARSVPVQTAPAPRHGLAYTGIELARMLGVALGVLGLGALLFFLARRRTESEEA